MRVGFEGCRTPKQNTNANTCYVQQYSVVGCATKYSIVMLAYG